MVRRAYFASAAWGGVGPNDLMREAGFTQGGLYNHFKSKDALVVDHGDRYGGVHARLFESLGKPSAPHHGTRFARQMKT
jgi:AcrR family transcriptional regulator